MKKIFFFLVFLGLIPEISFAGGDVSSAYLTVYKMYLFENADCSGTPVTVFSTTKTIDMAVGPEIGKGTVPDGTYRCIAMKISDQVTFTPATDVGTACKAGTAYSIDVCVDRPGSGETTLSFDPDKGTDPTSSSAYTSCSATSGVKDTPWIYISTASTVSSGGLSNAFSPPTSSGGCPNPNDTSTKCAMKLNNPVVISGDTTGTFIFGTDGKVQEEQGDNGSTTCGMAAPDWGWE